MTQQPFHRRALTVQADTYSGSQPWPPGIDQCGKPGMPEAPHAHTPEGPVAPNVGDYVAVDEIGDVRVYSPADFELYFDPGPG